MKEMSRTLLESACNLAPKRGDGDDFEGTLEKVTSENRADNHYAVTVTKNEDMIASFTGTNIELAVKRWFEWKDEYDLV